MVLNFLCENPNIKRETALFLAESSAKYRLGALMRNPASHYPDVIDRWAESQRNLGTDNITILETALNNPAHSKAIFELGIATFTDNIPDELFDLILKSQWITPDILKTLHKIITKSLQEGATETLHYIQVSFSNHRESQLKKIQGHSKWPGD